MSLVVMLGAWQRDPIDATRAGVRAGGLAGTFWASRLAPVSGRAGSTPNTTGSALGALPSPVRRRQPHHCLPLILGYVSIRRRFSRFA